MEKEFVATGRRKTSVASVRLREGSGNIIINGRTLEDYFPLDVQRTTILAPLEMAGTKGKYDMVIRVKGGGLEGQAIAVRLGLSRALVGENQDIHQELKNRGFLTRDARKRERKKYGLAGARKSFQFSKR